MQACSAIAIRIKCRRLGGTLSGARNRRPWLWARPCQWAWWQRWMRRRPLNTPLGFLCCQAPGSARAGRCRLRGLGSGGDGWAAFAARGAGVPGSAWPLYTLSHGAAQKNVLTLAALGVGVALLVLVLAGSVGGRRGGSGAAHSCHCVEVEVSGGSVQVAAHNLRLLPVVAGALRASLHSNLRAASVIMRRRRGWRRPAQQQQQLWWRQAMAGAHDVARKDRPFGG